MSRSTVTDSAIAPRRGRHFASHSSHMRNQTAISTRWFDARNCPANHEYPHRSFFSSQRPANLPRQPKLYLLPRRTVMIYTRSCTQKALYNLQKALCQSRSFTQHGPVLRSQPIHNGRMLLSSFNSIINSPLIQLHFFRFHFRITISVPPQRSPDRFPMTSARGSCHQYSPEGPRHSSNYGVGWIHLVDTSDLSIGTCHFLQPLCFWGDLGVQPNLGQPRSITGFLYVMGTL